jgi:hypothetical protein
MNAGRRLIKRKTGCALWARDSHMQGDGAPIGVACEAHLAIAAIDDLDGPAGFIRKSEGLLAGPCTRAIAAIMFRREQFVTEAQSLVELAPLPRVRT